MLSWFGRYLVVDDALIYARYIRSALQGQGLVFNVGDHVNALTSPLYCYVLLALSKLLSGQVLLVSKAITVGSLLAACFMAEAFAPYAGVLIAATAYFYSAPGLEMTFLVAMLALATLVYRSGRSNLLPVICVLLTLTRFEAGFAGSAAPRRPVPS